MIHRYVLRMMLVMMAVCVAACVGHTPDPIESALASKNKDVLYVAEMVLSPYMEEENAMKLDFNQSYDSQFSRIETYLNRYRALDDETRKEVLAQYRSRLYVHSPIWLEDWGSGE